MPKFECFPDGLIVLFFICDLVGGGRGLFILEGRHYVHEKLMTIVLEYGREFTDNLLLYVIRGQYCSILFVHTTL